MHEGLRVPETMPPYQLNGIIKVAEKEELCMQGTQLAMMVV